jgi:hypothetical protein
MTGQPARTGSGVASFGLSADDVESLEGDRRLMIDELVRTPNGRAVIRKACPDLDALGRALSEEIADLGRLSKQAESNTLRSKAASILLHDILFQGHRETTNDLYAHRSRTYRWAQTAHSWMDRKIRSRAKRGDTHRRRMLAHYWGWGAHLFTIVAALAMLFFSWFGLAALLIAVRIVGTAIVWSVAAFPSDDSPDKPVLDVDPRVCVLGHGGDLLVFTSFGMGLVRDAHESIGFLVLLAGLIMILGTIFRTAASASSYPVPRLHLERMVRGGSTFAAILLASIPSIAWWWSACVIMFLPTIFAWIEGHEAWRAMKLRADDPGMEPLGPLPQIDLTPEGDPAHRLV